MKKILLTKFLVFFFTTTIYCIPDLTLAAIAESIAKSGKRDDETDKNLAIEIYKQIDKNIQAEFAAKQINQKWPNTITPQIAKERYPLLKTSEEIGAATKRVLTKHKDLINIAPGVNCTGI